MRAERAKFQSCKDDKTIAQGQRSAALGCGRTMICSLSSPGFVRRQRAKPGGEREAWSGGLLPRAAAPAALPWAIVLLPLRGVGKANHPASGNAGITYLCPSKVIVPACLSRPVGPHRRNETRRIDALGIRSVRQLTIIVLIVYDPDPGKFSGPACLSQHTASGSRKFNSQRSGRTGECNCVSEPVNRLIDGQLWDRSFQSSDCRRGGNVAPLFVSLPKGKNSGQYQEPFPLLIKGKGI